MAKYVCPICGKIWYNTSDLAKCVTACDKATTETSAKKAEILRKKAADKAALDKAKADVDKGYKAFKNIVTAYNSQAIDYAKNYGETAATCTSTLSWKESRYPWNSKDKLNEIRSAYTINKDDLNKLIDDIFNF